MPHQDLVWLLRYLMVWQMLSQRLPPGAHWDTEKRANNSTQKKSLLMITRGHEKTMAVWWFSAFLSALVTVHNGCDMWYVISRVGNCEVSLREEKQSCWRKSSNMISLFVLHSQFKCIRAEHFLIWFMKHIHFEICNFLKNVITILFLF